MLTRYREKKHQCCQKYQEGTFFLIRKANEYCQDVFAVELAMSIRVHLIQNNFD